jgi:hypothetical protein
MIWHSRGMDKDWSLCHSHSEARRMPRQAGIQSPVVMSNRREISYILSFIIPAPFVTPAKAGVQYAFDSFQPVFRH